MYIFVLVVCVHYFYVVRVAKSLCVNLMVFETGSPKHSTIAFKSPENKM